MLASATSGVKGDTLEADLKYRDQLQGAWVLLVQAIGSVIRMDELLNLPGSVPLRDLLENPRAAQLRDILTAQEALNVVTQLCNEAGLEAGGRGTTDVARIATAQERTDE